MNTLKEKMYEWTEEKIRWYQQAETYPGNNRNQVLADIIFREMESPFSICDLGCGIGGLSIALSQKAEKVMAVDQNRDVISVLKDRIENKSLSNIEVRQGDYKKLLPQEERLDAAVICMAGNLEKDVPYVLEWARKKIFLITEITSYHHFKVSRKKKVYEDPERIRDFIKGQGLSYHEQIVRVHFGQPFKNQAEAVEFMRCYDRNESLEAIKAYLSEKLIRLEDKEFPLYFPCEKSYRIFSICKNGLQMLS